MAKKSIEQLMTMATEQVMNVINPGGVSNKTEGELFYSVLEILKGLVEQTGSVFNGVIKTTSEAPSPSMTGNLAFISSQTAAGTYKYTNYGNLSVTVTEEQAPATILITRVNGVWASEIIPLAMDLSHLAVKADTEQAIAQLEQFFVGSSSQLPNRINGKAVNANTGELVSADSYFYAKFKCSYGEIVKALFNNSSNNSGIAFFDSNAKFISGVTGKKNTYELVPVPKGTSYALYSYLKDDIASAINESLFDKISIYNSDMLSEINGDISKLSVDINNEMSKLSVEISTDFKAFKGIVDFPIVGFYRKGSSDLTTGGNYFTTNYISKLYIPLISYTHSDSASAYAVIVFDENKGFVQGFASLSDFYSTAVEYSYARFSIFNGYISTLVIENQIDDIEKTLDDIKKKVDADIVPKLANCFIKFGCIGDSYTHGYMCVADAPLAYNTHPDYAWPYYMTRITGQTWINFGQGGSSAKSWITGTLGKLAEIKKTENKCQGYCISLGINDLGQGQVIGTSDDFGTDNDTIAAWYYKLVMEVVSVNPDAKIFINTLPFRVTSRVQQLNDMLRSLAAHSKGLSLNVYCVDLAGDEWYNSKYYLHPIFTKDFSQGHYTPLGYEYMAECYNKALSKFMYDNYAEFQDVFTIDWGGCELNHINAN